MYVGHCWILFEVLMLFFWGRVRKPANIFPLSIFRQSSSHFPVWMCCVHPVSHFPVWINDHVHPVSRPKHTVAFDFIFFVLDLTLWLHISNSATACVSADKWNSEVFTTRAVDIWLYLAKKDGMGMRKILVSLAVFLYFHTSGALSRQGEILIGRGDWMIQRLIQWETSTRICVNISDQYI